MECKRGLAMTILSVLRLSVCQTITVTVTKALLLRPLLEDRGRITESIRRCVRGWTRLPHDEAYNNEEY